MNEIWKKIFKKYIEDFHAIDILSSDNIIDYDEAMKLKSKLLANIIVTMESEVDD